MLVLVAYRAGYLIHQNYLSLQNKPTISLPDNKTTIDQISAHQAWPIRQRVMWPDQPLAYVKLSNDASGVHLGLHVDGTLVSVISLFVVAGDAQFRKLATETSLHGNGYGSALLSHALDYLSALGVHRIWCNARVDKAIFYEKFGMTKTNDEFTKGGQHYVIMEKMA
jgi:GNAT superfamily N-acetyltransferase